ncbi:Coenzyme F420 hydrogenase/dehydrogenase, beta subunit C-terminal domain [Clostridium tyrobutyricum]|uniref:Coenzyme F420 hydrogenase/dehydrogenase, beta subunit C-terminal domain n=1 Tax=Clostridium tyrobutyricum TaxID=1519 RepID=UPI00241C8149|nr:Coenzyme F420 hydrogenase/dehydrogenase, beta subunit C-terminal domain [Clostridium tyrobutyricum]
MKLFKEKKECCACGACLNICPQKAIFMKEDEYGYLYPYIDKTKCINCKICQKICPSQNVININWPINVYGASSIYDKQILKSASGGVFATFAVEILKNAGVVFGVTLDYSKEILQPLHIGITNLKNLSKLQGSKYVQSLIGTTYQEAKNYLDSGKMVLFSGTPCQIAGLKSYLGKDYDKLITMDIICHGVPNAKFFQDYLKNVENKYKIKIIDFKFRDKSKGWGCNGKIIYKTLSNEKKERIISCKESSYYDLFLKSDIYRESCYECKYASINRQGDISIGDYWGIEKEYPDLFRDSNCMFSIKKGVSCIMVNTLKGNKYFHKINSYLNIKDTSFEQVALRNDQLNFPSKRGIRREKILKIYKNEGYKAVEEFFKKEIGFKIYIYKMKKIVPVSIKNLIKKYK